ncbi:MAG: xylose isomerase [Pseudomonadota bacterium]
MTTGYFGDLKPIAFDPTADTDLAFRHYNAEEVIAGKSLAEHLRFAVAYWHSFCWPGTDPFGGPTFERPWFGDTLDAARLKADVAFELFTLLGVPYFCFHDADVRPEGASFAETTRHLDAMVDYLGTKMETAGTRLLWGTANLFSHRRYMAGAFTNPDPEIAAYAAATVKTCLDATLRLGGENYVLWGGREGYETLLNTDPGREDAQAGRLLNAVVEYKHKIGFQGTILIEPKPQEPSKHQWDYDVATVWGFLKRHGLEGDVKVNIEQGHAILAGHSFEHEIALAASLGVFGSIDMNRNDYQSGWDTDQFPISVPEVALAYYEILKAGGFTTGGTNFDAKLRRQSLEPEDLVSAHVGAMDVCARGLKAAAAMLEDGTLEALRAARYSGWDEGLGAEILAGLELDGIADRVVAAAEPKPRSGRQERLEALLNRFV